MGHGTLNKIIHFSNQCILANVVVSKTKLNFGQNDYLTNSQHSRYNSNLTKKLF